MWKIKKEAIANNTTHYKILEQGKPISFQNWIDLLKQADLFIKFYIDVLKSNKYAGYFWEVKPANQNTLTDDFEFILVECNVFTKVKADVLSFKKYFSQNEQVARFPNLSGDAQLVVPTPSTEKTNYAHLAAFTREAPIKQQLAFWKMVSVEYEKSIGQRTKWLSTSGLGVYWLHVRIDRFPKYYQYKPYKELTIS